MIFENKKLIVHIGMGKTGSSSIQATLFNNIDKLKDLNFKYLGIGLDRCQDEFRFEWQCENSIYKYLQSEINENEIYSVLKKEILETNFNSYIWSNEIIFERDKFSIRNALKKLYDEGLDVKIICYIRRHDSWSRSAYFQWEIQNKYHKGPVKPFFEWIKNSNLEVFKKISFWEEDFKENFYLINFDEIENVLDHFFKLLNINVNYTTGENVTANNLILQGYAMFNSLFEDHLKNDEFGKFLESLRIKQDFIPIMDDPNNFFPNDQDMEDVLNRYKNDILKINQILKNKNQKEFNFNPKQNYQNLSPYSMQQLLLKMIFELKSEISELRDRIK